MKRTPIRRVSKKRSAQLREYSKLRKKFLADRPFCEWFIAENHLDPDQPYYLKGTNMFLDYAGREHSVPSSRDIHHRNKRHGTRLNDVAYWMAVSRMGHKWIEMNKKEARLKGYLMDI